MKLENYDDLNADQLDALREIGNIGSGNAASALSSMLDKPVDIAVPTIKILDYETVVEALGGPEELLVSLLLPISGDINGMIMFLLRKTFAHMVIQTLTEGSFIDTDELDEMDQSAIQEVGNIMAASYINAISELTGLRIDLSVPNLCVDMVGAILSVPAIHFANISDKIIFIEDGINHVEDDPGSVVADPKSSSILLIPDVESLGKIMTSLGLDE